MEQKSSSHSLTQCKDDLLEELDEQLVSLEPSSPERSPVITLTTYTQLMEETKTSYGPANEEIDKSQTPTETSVILESGEDNCADSIYDDGLTQNTPQVQECGTLTAQDQPCLVSSGDEGDTISYNRPKRIKSLTKDEIIIEGLTSGRDAPVEVALGGIAGRGLFATGPISKDQWLCEYKGIVYPRSQMQSHIDEYKRNGEGSYIIASKHPVGGETRLCWDATRYFHQLGRYINHGKNFNATTTAPRFARGKWRIGFVAVRDIKVGEEILWDYGVRGEEERALCESGHESGHESGRELVDESGHESEHESVHQLGNESMHESGNESVHDSGNELVHESGRESVDELGHEPEVPGPSGYTTEVAEEPLTILDSDSDSMKQIKGFPKRRRVIISSSSDEEAPVKDRKVTKTIFRKRNTRKGKARARPRKEHMESLPPVPRKDSRKYHFCPFKSCRRACKKLSQHIQYKHPHIRPRERRILCAKAKVAKGKGALKPMHTEPTQLTLHSLSQGIQQSEVSEEELEIDEQEPGEEEEHVINEEAQEEDRSEILSEDVVVAEGSGDSSTEEVVQVESTIDPDHPFLVGLREFLMSRHGKGRSEKEAKQISAAVSQFLEFSGPELDPKHLYDARKLDTYLQSLEHQGQKATTQHSKLCRIRQGLMYANLSLEPSESVKVDRCLALISNWLSTIGKEARKSKRAQLEDMSPSSMADIDKFATSEKMVCLLNKIVQDIKGNKKVSNLDVRQVMIWLAGSLLHTNAQRPGSVTNATLQEFQAAITNTEGRQSYKTFWVANHKTGTTGRAKLSAPMYLSKRLDLYVNHIRPTLEGRDSRLLFPNRDGKPLDHLSRHVNNLATKLGFKLPPNATATRHAAATAVAGKSEKERGAVATAMSHSERTQKLYYAANKGRKEAVEGYRVMETLRQEERGNQGSSGLRVPFSETETETVSEYFSQHVSATKPPSIAECRQFLDQHHLNRDAKQIRDKVRNLIRKHGK